MRLPVNLVMYAALLTPHCWPPLHQATARGSTDISVRRVTDHWSTPTSVTVLQDGLNRLTGFSL